MRSLWQPHLAGLLWMVLVAGCSMDKRQPFFGKSAFRPTQAGPEDVAAARDAPEAALLPSTRFAAARLFESHRQFDKAIEQYRKAIAGDPSYVEAHHRLGVLLGYLGRHEEAERALRRAVQLSPSAGGLRNNLAFELILQRRWAEAERELRRAIMLNPDFDQARTNLGLALGAQGRFDDSLAEYRRVLPEPDAYYNLGLAYRAHQRNDDARKAFTHVLAINPNFEAARRQLDNLTPPSVEFMEKTDLQDSVAPPRGAVDPQPVVVVSFIGSESEATASGAAKAALEDTQPPARPTIAEETAESLDEATATVDGAGPPASLRAGDGPVGRVPLAAPAPLSDAEPATPTAVSICPGDFDNDGDVDSDDFDAFRGCFSGPAIAFQDGCNPGDFDDDGDVDLLDYRLFQTKSSGP